MTVMQETLLAVLFSFGIVGFVVLVTYADDWLHAWCSDRRRRKVEQRRRKALDIHPILLIQPMQPLTSEQFEETKRRFQTVHRAGQSVVLSEGARYQPLANTGSVDCVCREESCDIHRPEPPRDPTPEDLLRQGEETLGRIQKISQGEDE